MYVMHNVHQNRSPRGIRKSDLRAGCKIRNAGEGSTIVK